jgi:hypothetical protein
MVKPDAVGRDEVRPRIGLEPALLLRDAERTSYEPPEDTLRIVLCDNARPAFRALARHRKRRSRAWVSQVLC